MEKQKKTISKEEKYEQLKKAREAKALKQYENKSNIEEDTKFKVLIDKLDSLTNILLEIKDKIPSKLKTDWLDKK